MKVLLIEDQENLRTEILDYLSDHQILCESASGLREAYHKLSYFDYDIILLDLMLPEGTGLDLLRKLKEVNSRSAILIISAKDSLDDKLSGLNLGADDYLAKPFHLAELRARVLALYRRMNFGGNTRISFEEISIDMAAQEVYIDNQPLVLTQKEYELLLLFLSNKNRVLGKNTIAESLWGDYVDALDHFDFIYQHIKNIRKKMHKLGAKPYIQNVYGSGYKFNTYIT